MAQTASIDLVADRVDRNIKIIADHESRLRTIEFRLARVAATAAMLGSAVPHLVSWLWSIAP